MPAYTSAMRSAVAMILIGAANLQGGVVMAASPQAQRSSVDEIQSEGSQFSGMLPTLNSLKKLLQVAVDVDVGEEGGTVMTGDGSVVGFGDDYGEGPIGLGAELSDGTGIGIGTDGGGAGTPDGAGVGVSADGVQGVTEDGTTFSVDGDGVNVNPAEDGDDGYETAYEPAETYDSYDTNDDGYTSTVVDTTTSGAGMHALHDVVAPVVTVAGAAVAAMLAM